jgi:predicted ATPase
VAELPTGTVTLLFTDIEGSTKLLHELGDRYADVLAAHRRLLREAFRARGGVEVDTQGDAFFYAFPNAMDAAVAAQQAQRSLAGGPVSVRIGLHAGEPTLADEGYVGIDVHRAARIMSAGHGGQILVSETTCELLGSGVELRDLGEHRLKDIEGSAWIYQIGTDVFPPLKTISNTNLPRPASSFVGRRGELEEVLALLRQESVRLLTLTGPGGSGKTRLAIEAAAELVGEYPNGVFWVGLAALREPALVTETIAQTLGAKDGLAAHIGERELLLLLDNLEQVVEAAPELSALLESCPNLALLTTSRELLRVRGEMEYEVPPLAASEAIALFCERARSKPSAEVGELCARLDNLPLAVELAAARVKALSPAQILQRLSQRLDLLKGGRDADPRQQTLRATIDWSYELCSAEEQMLFRRLGVFAGGCTLEAAEDVADADLETLQSLVEKSLLRHSSERFWMLETLREYALERLAQSGELEASKRRHADFVLNLAAQVETSLGSDADVRKSFASEEDNFRAALEWAEHAGETDSQLELISRSWPFWWYRGHSGEGLRWVDSALARSEGERSGRRVNVLAAGAMFAYRHGELGMLKRYAEESLGTARTLSDTRNMIWPLILRGIYASEVGNYDDATSFYEEAIAIAREAGNRKLVGIANNNLGVVAQQQGDFPRAVRLFKEALDISRELRTPDEAALETLNLALSLYQTGRLGEAAETAKDGFALAHEVENLTALAWGFVLLGALACRQGRAEAAAPRLLGAAEALADRVGEDVVGDPLILELIETTAKKLVGALGENGYAAAHTEGKAMSLDQAVEYALASID